jgi:hypothetical protein
MTGMDGVHSAFRLGDAYPGLMSLGMSLARWLHGDIGRHGE